MCHSDQHGPEHAQGTFMGATGGAGIRREGSARERHWRRERSIAQRAGRTAETRGEGSTAAPLSRRRRGEGRLGVLARRLQAVRADEDTLWQVTGGKTLLGTVPEAFLGPTKLYPR